MFGDYFQLNNLRCTLKNVDQAFVDLKAAGRLEIVRTPQEVEAEKAEALRQEVYRLTAEKIAPAKLNFADWDGTMRPLSKYLTERHGGRMTADTLYEAILALKLSLPWVREPQGLDKLRRAAELGFFDTRDDVRRYNYADQEKAKAAAKKAAAEFRTGVEAQEKAEEARRIEAIVQGYEAVKFNKPKFGQTETIRGLLRSYIRKFNCNEKDTRNLLRNLPDDPNYAQAWLANKLRQGSAVSEPEIPTGAFLAPKV